MKKRKLFHKATATTIHSSTELENLEKTEQPKRECRSSYSVVTAAYNVGRYLNDFFSSFANQTISFEKHVEIIVVDDGSTDDTKAVVMEWKAKYPRNIKYFHQENQGQGEARNVGMQYARHDWVTFTDPDDFVNPEFFEQIDQSITQNQKVQPVKMVSTNMIFFFEDINEYKDTHPLRYRFANGGYVLPIGSQGKHITLNVATIVFKRAQLLDQKIRFNSSIKPGFEDSHFVNRYILNLKHGAIAYLQDAKYFYRKRSDGTSTLDTGWLHPGRYNEQLKLGSMGLINASIQKYGAVSNDIQRVVFYDLAWHFRRLIDSPSAISHLNAEQITTYKTLISRVMDHISIETIMNFELAGIWFYHKLGILKKYKNFEPDFNIIYVDAIDQLRNLVKLRSFSTEATRSEQFWIDGEVAIPTFSKTQEHFLLDESFLYERIVWISLGDANQLNVKLNSKETRISLKGRQHRNGIFISDIVNHFRISKEIDPATLSPEHMEIRAAATSRDAVMKYGDCWVLMDRNTQADDNAEHLYRYIIQRHPTIRAFFVLNEDSHDWQRLEREGFNLIPFGTLEHKCALINASHFISSHADKYIFAELEKKWFGDICNYRYTFLQHGIIKDDLSNWLNHKNIDCFITSTHAEYRSIVEQSKYKFSAKEVALTGLPRHDRLITQNSPTKRTILIMPTWRMSLVGPVIGQGNEREINPDFGESQFLQEWKAVLHSTVLRDLALKNDYEVVFFPHANIKPYIENFDTPSYIKISSSTESSIQDQFVSATIILTDYSSVAFELAAIRRAVIYFHFDADDVFAGGHFYQKGYFDYAEDGFGPICQNCDSVIDQLRIIIDNNGSPEDHYLAKMNSTFAFSDTANCERTFKAITKLDKNFIDDADAAPAVLEHLNRAFLNFDWRQTLAAGQIAIEQNYLDSADAEFYSAVAARNLGQPEIALSFLDAASLRGYSDDKVLKERIALAIYQRDLDFLDNCANKILKSEESNVSEGVVALLCKAARMQFNTERVGHLLNLASNGQSMEILRERAELSTLLEDWPLAFEFWEQVQSSTMDDDSLVSRAKCYRNLGYVTEAATLLRDVANRNTAYGFAIEFAEVSFSLCHWKDAAKYFSAVTSSAAVPPDVWLRFAKALRKTGQIEAADKALLKASGALDERTLLQETALLCTSMKRYEESIMAWRSFLQRKDLRPNRDAWLHLAQVQCNVRDYLGAMKSLEKFESFGEHSKKSVAIRKELTLLKLQIEAA